MSAAAVTPHRKQGHEVDLGAALEVVDYLAGAGIEGIALMGATGEFPHLRFDDRVRLAYMAVKRSRVAVLISVSHSTLDGAIELAREACSAGASGLLLMPPIFFRYDPADVRQFYLRFLDNLPNSAPLFLYNLPQFTSAIPPALAVELLATGRFAGIKDSSGDFEGMKTLIGARPAGGWKALVGNDTIFTRARQAGADGVISGCACAVPELLLGLDRAIAARDEARIARLQGFLEEFISWIDGFPTPFGIKAATAARGLKTGGESVPLPPEKLARVADFQSWFKDWLPGVRREAGGA